MAERHPVRPARTDEPPDALDDAARAAPSGTPDRSPSTGYVLAVVLAGVTVLFHVATSQGYGYFRDELYYVACSDRLAAGYVDHPPLLELLLRIVRPVFGDSPTALRLLPALAAGASVLLTAAVVRTLGGGLRAMIAALVPVMVAPIYVGTFGILTTNAFDVVIWTAILLLIVRQLRGADPRGWLAVGALVGIGFENKHGMAFLVIALGAGFLLTPVRREWRNRWLWAGMTLAVLLVLPHLAWQVANGWPTLEFMENARDLKHLTRPPLAVLGEQVLILNPLAAPIWIAGLVAFWRQDGGRLPMLAWTYVGLLVLLIAGRGKSYYVTPVYPALFAAGAVAFERSRRWSWLTVALVPLVLVVGAITAPLAKPLLSEETTIRWQKTLGLDPTLGVDERNPLGALPQHFADQHGWPELAAAVARVHRGLPPDERERACIFTSNYGEAGAIDLFGPPLGLPPAISSQNNYWLWGPRGCSFDVVVVVGFAAADVAGYVERVETAATFDCPYCMPFENKPILVTRGLKVPVDVLWARVKRYI